MAIRKLHGSVDSVGTLRVMASIFEHQLDFDFVPVDLSAGDNTTDSFLSLSPFGEIPVFQDGDLTLFENRAAMRYISHEYATQAIQQVYIPPMQQGVVATWIDVSTHHFEPPAQRLIVEPMEKPRSGQAADEAAVAEAEAKLAQVLEVYEERLGRSEYLGGDKFTSADLTHLPYLYMLKKTRAKKMLESGVYVKRWCERALARPAWAKVVEMVENEARV